VRAEVKELSDTFDEMVAANSTPDHAAPARTRLMASQPDPPLSDRTAKSGQCPWNHRQIGNRSRIVGAHRFSSFVVVLHPAVDHDRSTHPMLTQEMVTVLVMALVVNGIVVASLIVAPRLRDWSHRRSMDRAIAAGGSMSGRFADVRSAEDAGQPWFLTSAANGSPSVEGPECPAVESARLVSCDSMRRRLTYVPFSDPRSSM